MFTGSAGCGVHGTLSQTPARFGLLNLLCTLMHSDRVCVEHTCCMALPCSGSLPSQPSLMISDQWLPFMVCPASAVRVSPVSPAS